MGPLGCSSIFEGSWTYNLTYPHTVSKLRSKGATILRSRHTSRPAWKNSNDWNRLSTRSVWLSKLSILPNCAPAIPHLPAVGAITSVYPAKTSVYLSPSTTQRLILLKKEMDRLFTSKDLTGKGAGYVLSDAGVEVLPFHGKTITELRLS